MLLTAQQGELAIPIGLFVVMGILCAGVAVRVLRGPTPWTVADALLGCLVLIWSGTVCSWAMSWLETGQWVLEDAEEISVIPALAGSMVGGLSGAAVALLRAPTSALGLVPSSWRWCCIALGCLPVVVVLSSLWLSGLEMMGFETEQQAILELLEGPAWQVWLVGIYAVAVAPVVEELLFRGFLLPPLCTRIGVLPGIAAGGALFGAFHVADPASVLPLVFLGMVLGWLRMRSQSLVPALVLHGANNGLALASALLMA